MKEVIVSNQYYELVVDPSHNRLHYAVKGFWPNAAAVPNYYNDFVKALSKLNRGFDIVVNVLDMKTPPEDVAQLRISAQKLCIEKGVSRTAQVLDQSMVRLVMDRYSRESQLDMKAFGSVVEAEVWLDGFKK